MPIELTKTQQELFDKDSERVFDVFEMSHGLQALAFFWEHLDENPTLTVAELLSQLNDEDEEED